MCHLCLFLRTGQIWQFSVPHSNSRSEQTTTVNKRSFNFLLRDICKEHLLWKHVNVILQWRKTFSRLGLHFWLCFTSEGEKPWTAAGCWQTMPTSKPQLWNFSAVRGGTRSPLCLTPVVSSVQTFMKKLGKVEVTKHYIFFFKSAFKKTRRHDR